VIRFRKSDDKRNPKQEGLGRRRRPDFFPWTSVPGALNPLDIDSDELMVPAMVSGGHYSRL
jgi:hypothetical protein